MRKILIISDSHSFIHDKIVKYSKKCDEVWHAGDIGDVTTLNYIKKLFKKTRIVYGNIDDKEVKLTCRKNEIFIVEGLKIIITHIGISKNKINPNVLFLIKKELPDILVYGHTHILKIHRYHKYNNILMINPGAIGNYGIHTKKTMIEIQLNNKKILKINVIEF